ncbi:MAG: endo alpha-1,4 polygalactosaminidase [Actinobacteria bacterium]|nr:endo alpha-1,4 polygalactosaminidase [Actinomycetota bacterium]
MRVRASIDEVRASTTFTVLDGASTPPTTAPPTTPPTTAPPTTGMPRTWWRPEIGVVWQWQLSGLPVDTSVSADVFEIDLFDNDKSVVDRLHAQGRKVICYLSAGSYESWRPDAASFPASVLGNGNGWPGERWLDIRALDVLGPIMENRLDRCAEKGFDAVEADNVDGYANGTGFPLTGAHQIAYNRFLADAAHARGLGIGLKNDVEQIGSLVGFFDFAVNEECAEYDECELSTPFIKAGKAVLHAEYSSTTDQYCPLTTRLGFSSIRKNPDLDAWRQLCP